MATDQTIELLFLGVFIFSGIAVSFVAWLLSGEIEYVSILDRKTRVIK
jgi:hypothetical protein